MGDGWTSSCGGVNAVDRYYKYSTRVNLREPVIDPNEPEVKYVVRQRYAAQLCSRVFCPPGKRQAVADSGQPDASPAHWLSCGDLDTAADDAELGYHDNGGHLSVFAAQDAGMTSSDPELYSCASMSAIHTTQPQPQEQFVNGISLHCVVTSEI